MEHGVMTRIVPQEPWLLLKTWAFSLVFASTQAVLRLFLHQYAVPPQHMSQSHTVSAPTVARYPPAKYPVMQAFSMYCPGGQLLHCAHLH